MLTHCSLLALDFMGDFAYGGAFNTMRSGEDTSRVRKGAEKGVSLMEALGTVPWVRPFVLALPQNSARAMMQASLRVAEARRTQGASARDLFYYLVRVRAPRPASGRLNQGCSSTRTAKAATRR
jgi:hypothetical protein